METGLRVFINDGWNPNLHEYFTDVFTPGDENHCHCPMGSVPAQ
jgi:hypothetical protein